MNAKKIRRRWVMRGGAILLGLLPFLLVEGGLRLLGWPSVPPPVDPFVELHNLRPLFELDEESGLMRIGAERMNLFAPASFKLDKPPGTFRVFALGGSTTQGEPYSTPTAFPKWLELNLQAATSKSLAPGDSTANVSQVEVINCGGLSYASYRVLAVLREVMHYQPDLIVVYSGHNEYLEYRSYAGYHEQSFGNRWRSELSDVRLVQLARLAFGQSNSREPEARQAVGDRTVLKSEVDALLDYAGGLADYRRGESWYQPIPVHFRWNVERMAEACRAAKVPLILVRPVSNLLDCPPIKFEADPKLSSEQLKEFETHWEAARSESDSTAAIERLRSALAIDPRHAGANYLLGRLQYDLRDYSGAHVSLKLARDCDVCPLRATSEIVDSVSDVAFRSKVPLVDAEALFAAVSRHGIADGQWLVDHVHPTVEGHQLLGEALAERCLEMGLVHPLAGWEQRRQELYAHHLNDLDEPYFQRGKQRLQGLLLWTQGRAKKVREP